MATISIPRNGRPVAGPRTTPVILPVTEERQRITQAKLRHIVMLRNSIELAQAELDAAEVEVKAALESGASVEPGVHRASLKEFFRRSVAWRDVAEKLADRLFGAGRGRDHCEGILNSTKPNRTVRLVVS